MKKRNLLKACTSAAALLLMFIVASPALAQDTTNTNANSGEFQGWDADQSGDLSLDEFTTGVSGTAYYSRWDSDGDGNLSEEEWNNGMNENLNGYDGRYEEWDADGDGVIGEDDFYQGTYNTLDENGDEAMDGYEWGNWYDNDIF